ncbi:MAG: hypothetical protein DMG71_08525 [Acidobacteria bacterium]|nr:MAG: hypothetical protein DMG71_08525 [Acidobacteriota bacterium]
MDAGVKFVPFSVRMNPELPAFTEDGLSDVRVGAVFTVALMANSADPEFPPPGDGLVTLTSAKPELATSAVPICACN